ncbi:MAG TPA: hypothetical protein VF761_06030 [Gemmatimonadaceae bacterium]
MRTRRRSIVGVLGAAAAALLVVACADDPGGLGPSSRSGRPALATAADALPGTDVNAVGPSKVLLGSLAQVAMDVGKISVSADAVGTDNFPATIRVNKPVGATVKKVYVSSASTGFTGYVIPDGDVQIAGVPISWDLSTPSSISSTNHWADATTELSAAMNALPPGLNAVSYFEASNTYSIDGTILMVVWNDPAQLTDQTLVVMFGAQNIAGDNFYVNLAQPIANASDPTLRMDMGLGISYSYEPAGQYSRVEVNGLELSNCAGGQDDGQPENGALITVGGIGDLNTNPPSGCSESIGPRADDELYSLVPYLHTGDTQVHVFSINPSNDDNIYLAYFLMNVAGNVTTNPDGVPPTCAMTKSGTNASGQKYIEITVQDTKSGLTSIQVMQSTNATTVVPPFPPFTTSPVVVTATKINQASGSQVELKATDAAGNVTTCDPADVTLKIENSSRAAHATIAKIGASEHFIEVENDALGVSTVTAMVNGQRFTVADLASGEHRSIDVASAMHAGKNAIVLSAAGAKGASAWVLVHD